MRHAVNPPNPAVAFNYFHPRSDQAGLSVRRDPYVETLRGVAIILVVLGHMIGSTADGGMRVSDDSFYRYLYYTLSYIRLPLFTVISGWVYASKPLGLGQSSSGLILGKFRRLLIPMFVVGTLLFLFRMVIPGTNTTPDPADLPRILVFPYDVYWYLFSLFLIFVAVSFIDNRPSFRKITGWATVLAFSFVVLFVSETFLDPVPNFFSFKGAAYLFPFFLIGVGLNRFHDVLLSRKSIVIALSIFVLSFVVQQLAWFGFVPMQGQQSVLGMTVGISAALLLFRLRVYNSFLVFIGGFAYGIFLFHVFFTGGSRIILLRLGLDNQLAILVLGVIFAILFSIVAELAIRRSAFLSQYLLGLRKREKG